MGKIFLQGRILSTPGDALIYFLHPSLVMYSFATPPIKLKRGQQIGGELLITNHLDQSL